MQLSVEASDVAVLQRGAGSICSTSIFAPASNCFGCIAMDYEQLSLLERLGVPHLEHVRDLDTDPRAHHRALHQAQQAPARVLIHRDPNGHRSTKEYQSQHGVPPPHIIPIHRELVIDPVRRHA